MPSSNITVLVENTAGKHGLLAEHGLAYLIQLRGETILFDTGQSPLLLRNADTLGINLTSIRTVVLSHRHYDHTGGLHAVLPTLTSRPTLYAHPALTEETFAQNPDGSGRSIGLSDRDRQAISDGANWIPVNEPVHLPCGLHLTGPIPRQTDFEDAGGPFFQDAACNIPDPIWDDQAAFIETKHGTTVLLGCAHAGVINTLQHIQTLTDGAPIHTVMGGMHLHNASSERLIRTLEALRTYNIQRMIPCHCTGLPATARFWYEFQSQLTAGQTGLTLQLDI